MTEQYKIFETTLNGTAVGNPFKEVWLKATFTNGSDYYTVNGFYCSGGRMAEHCMALHPNASTF